MNQHYVEEKSDEQHFDALFEVECLPLVHIDCTGQVQLSVLIEYQGVGMQEYGVVLMVAGTLFP